MRCEDIREMLSGHIDGVLDSRQEQQLQEHLDGCETCRQELAALKQTVELLQDLPEIEPPEGLCEQIIARIDEEPEIRGQDNVIFASFGGPQFRAAVAALVVVSVGLFAFRQMSRNPVREAKYDLDMANTAPEENQVPVPKGMTLDAESTEELDSQTPAPKMPGISIDKVNDEIEIKDAVRTEAVERKALAEKTAESEEDTPAASARFRQKSERAERRAVGGPSPSPAEVPVPSRAVRSDDLASRSVASKVVMREGARAKKKEQKAAAASRRERMMLAEPTLKKDAAKLMQTAEQEQVPVPAMDKSSSSLMREESVTRLRITAAPEAVQALVKQYAAWDKDERLEAKRASRNRRELVVRMPLTKAPEFMKQLGALGRVVHEERPADHEDSLKGGSIGNSVVSGEKGTVTFVITILPVQK